MFYLKMEDLKVDNDDLMIEYEPYHCDVECVGVQANDVALEPLKIKIEEKDDDSSEEEDFEGFHDAMIVTGEKRPDNDHSLERKPILSKDAVKLMTEVISDKEDVAEILKFVTRKYELLSQKLDSLVEALQEERAIDTSLPIGSLHSKEDPNKDNLETNSTNQYELPAPSTPVTVPGGIGEPDPVHPVPLCDDNNTTSTTQFLSSPDLGAIWNFETIPQSTNDDIFNIISGIPNLLEDTAPMPLSRLSASIVSFNSNVPSDAKVESMATNSLMLNGQNENQTSFTHEPDLLTRVEADTEKMDTSIVPDMTTLPSTPSRFTTDKYTGSSPTSKETWTVLNISSQADVGKVNNVERSNIVDGCASNFEDILTNPSSRSDPDNSPHQDDFSPNLDLHKDAVFDGAETSTNCDASEQNLSSIVTQNKSPKPSREKTSGGHILAQTGEKPHKCPHCIKSFCCKLGLSRHIRTHTRRKFHECSHCFKKFFSKSQWQDHLLTHTGERPHPCHLCDQKFGTEGNLGRHLLVHEVKKAKKLHECRDCTMKFSERMAYELHRLTHIEKLNHECRLCNKIFSLKKELKKHMLIHSAEKPHGCPHCSKRFNWTAQLNSHILIHTVDKSFQCSYCSKIFNRKEHLQNHLFIHTGERPHECTYCNRQFITKGGLRKHLLTHTKEYTFNCPHCIMKFPRLETLRLHIFTHTAESPHKCPHCYKKFSLEKSVQKHILTHTGEKPQ